MLAITRLTGLMLLMWIAANAQAGGTKTVNMTLHLVITQPPPCTVADVDAVMPTEVTTRANDDYTLGAATPINIPIHCEWDISDTYTSMKLYFQGNTTTINNQQVLQTSIPDLGVRLMQPSGSIVPISLSEGITVQSVPGHTDYTVKIEAQLLKKDPYKILTEGDYSASATMILEYQ